MNRDIDVRQYTTDVSTHTKHKTALLSMICAAMYGVTSPALAVSPLDDSQMQAQSISLVPLTAVKKQKAARCTVLKKKKPMKQMTPEERRECGVQQSDDADDTGNASMTASDESSSDSESDRGNDQTSSDDGQADQLDASGNADATDGASNTGSESELSDGAFSTSSDVSGNSGNSDVGAATDAAANDNDGVGGVSGDNGSGIVAGGFDPSSLPDSLSPEDQSMLGLGLGSNLADTNVTAGIASLDANMVSNDLLNSALDFQNQQILTNMNGAGGTLLVLDEIALGELRKSPYTLLIDGANDNGAQDSSDFSYQGYDSFYIYESVNGRGINDGTDFEIPSISSGPGQVTVTTTR